MQSNLNKLLAEIANMSPIENLEAILPDGLGKKLNELREMASEFGL